MQLVGTRPISIRFAAELRRDGLRYQASIRGLPCCWALAYSPHEAIKLVRVRLEAHLLQQLQPLAVH